jgi:hypothetical protein
MNFSYRLYLLFFLAAFLTSCSSSLYRHDYHFVKAESNLVNLPTTQLPDQKKLTAFMPPAKKEAPPEENIEREAPLEKTISFPGPKKETDLTSHPSSRKKTLLSRADKKGFRKREIDDGDLIGGIAVGLIAIALFWYYAVQYGWAGVFTLLGGIVLGALVLFLLFLLLWKALGLDGFF